jgi:hypothetical protein
MSDFSDVLRSASGYSGASRTPELLIRPTRDLLGVSDAAAQALSTVGIHSIFDLGASNLFASSRALVEYARNGAATNRFGLVAGDLLGDGPSAVSPEVLADLPLARLRVLTPDEANALSTALDVATIADLANWPPQREARRLLGEIAGSTQDPEDQQAEDLRPRFGQYPTERVYYSTLVMLEMMGNSGPLQDLTGPVSLGPAVNQPAGITRSAIGALLTFEQSWYAQGVTLGHMLHSLSLAPGEVTRVAVIDWSRRTRAFASEVIGETEQLDSASTHARALSEVQTAVANDFQAGGSSASSSATSTSHSEAGAQGSGLLQSLVMSGDASMTDQTATTTAQADSSSWSLGNRSVMGSLTQNVNDRTEQHSSSVRNRRATAVREVSQSEHENVSTRIIANYNHMHALNMQYYEVVQVYRTEARLHRADRCLFIPMETLDFSGAAGWAVVERFRGALLAAALNGRVRALLADDTTAVEIAPARRVFFPSVRPDLFVGYAPNSLRLSTLTAARGALASAANPLSSAAVAGADVASATTNPPATRPPAPAAAPMPATSLWDVEAVAKASRLLDRPLVRPDSDSLFVPDDTELIAISFDQVAIRTVRLDHVGAVTSASQAFTVPTDSGRIDLVPSARFVELDAINVVKADDPAAHGTMTLHCAYLGRRFTLPGIPLDLAQGTAPQKVATLTNDQADRRTELQQHLQNNRDYYSHAVFRSLDAATLTFVLSRYQLSGRPLIDQVEPRPITIAGNYIVLRAPVADDEAAGLATNGQAVTWNDLLASRGLDRTQALDRRLIPIPTGGVFAEAVLGRSNSAEKLDITRFWHWQDSPVPIQPSDISPVDTGSRATAEDLKPGQLSSPVLNILNPSSLPDPTGLGAVLGALTNLNFRDMSGLAGTQGLVKTGETATLDAATAAGKLASDNLKTEAQKAVSMGQIAADIAKSAIAADAAKSGKAGAAGGGAGGGVGGISRDGAVLNQGRKMDSEASQAGSGGSGEMSGPGGSNGAGGSPGGAGGDSFGSPGNTGDQMMTTGGNEAAAFRNALYGALGGSGLDAANLVLASADKSGGGGAPLMSPFRTGLANKLKFDDKLWKAFSPNLPDLNNINPNLPGLEDAALVIVALNDDGTRPFASHRQVDMFYSGSLLKVAAMYAAFQLRSAVNDLGATMSVATDPDPFKKIKDTFDDQIDQEVPRIKGTRGITREMRIPKYSDIFTATQSGGHYTFDFAIGPDDSDDDHHKPASTFFANLKRMIIGSHNISAMACIRALGYSWINGVLQKAGFFLPLTDNGIWLAGDYDNWATVDVQSVNDGLVKQATTCLDMAKLFVLLNDDDLVKDDPASHPDTGNLLMMEFLRQAVMDPGARSLLKRPFEPNPPPFQILQSKIGVGQLKGGSCVDIPDKGIRTNRCTYSEAAVVQHSSGRKFVVVWQNLVYLKDNPPPHSWDDGLRRIADVIKKTMDAYELDH